MAPLMLLQQPLLVRAAIRDTDWRMALMFFVSIIVFCCPYCLGFFASGYGGV